MNTRASNQDAVASAGEAVLLSFEQVMETLQLAPQRGEAADHAPPPKGVVARVWDNLADIKEAWTEDTVPDRAEVLAGVCRHIIDVIDLASTMISSEVGALTAVTVKLLWMTDSSDGIVHTFLRNTRSRHRREAYEPLDDYPYTDNTAFELILSEGAASFKSDNLLKDEAAGRYRNANDKWPAHYNTTYVVPIPPRTENLPVIGFLCADSEFLPISSDSVGASLSSMACHLYNIFGLCSKVVQFDYAGGLAPKASFQSSSLGWRWDAGRLAPLDHGNQLAFQQAMAVIQYAFDNHFAGATEPPGEVRQGGRVRPGPSGGQVMKDDPPTWLELVTDEDRDPTDAKAIASARAMTPEQHLAFMEKIADKNPYAKAFVERARRSR